MPTKQASSALAGEIRAELARRRLTPIQLANATGISVHKIRRRLSGDVGFTVDELSAISTFLERDPASLLLGGAA
jgi:transcriptional regulator with XRE-family HTH domain